MSETFTAKRRVEFRDTDAAGIVHFSVFFAYMEEAEHQLLRHIGLGVFTQIDGKTVSWPRVAAKCDYLKAIKFEQVIAIEVSIARIGNKSVTFNHHFKNESGETVAKGIITTVCCEIAHSPDPRKTMKPVPVQIPGSFIEKLKPYLVAE